MLRNILGTFGAKFIIAIANLIIVILTSQFLGAEGKGITSLILMSITIVLLFSSIVGGPALVYLVPRMALLKLLIPSYIWAILTSLIFTAIIAWLNIISTDYIIHLFFLSLLLALLSIHLAVLLGKENIKANNLLSLLQSFATVMVLLVLFLFLKKHEVQSYVLALYIAYITCLLISTVVISRYIQSFSLAKIKKVIQQLFQYGSLAQLSNIIQFMNYRLSFYFLEIYSGTATVGIYSIGVSLSEALWLIGGSIAMVQYARIANSKDIEYSRQLTYKLAKLSFTTTLVLLIPLLLLPESFFIFIFGQEFGAVREVIWYLSPGIGSFGLSIIFSHYFGGIGKYYINTIASFIGFIFMIGLSFILIPTYSYAGAGIAASVSYLSSSIFLIWMFVKETKFNMLAIIPSLQDFRFFMEAMKNFKF